MRNLLPIALGLALLAAPAAAETLDDPAPAAAAAFGDPAQSAWALSAHVGIGMGSQTDPSFAWRGGLHRRLSGASTLGLEAGRLRWDGVPRGGYAHPASIEPFRGLAKGGNELQMIALALRLHGPGVGPRASSPLIALGAGAYRQVVRNAVPGFDDERDGRIRPGFSLALGGAAMRGIAPGAEIRFEYIETSPAPSTYFTIGTALFANR